MKKELEGEFVKQHIWYAKANNKYMKNYDKKKSSYLEDLDANNSYGYAMRKELPVGNFKWLDENDISKFNDENSNVRYIFEADVEYPKHICMLNKDLPFLPEKMKLNKSTKPVCNVQDKKKLCSTHSSFKASIKSWIKINKIT